jgi:hypothetical protein
MSWLTVAAKLAPHVASIAHAVVPVFTTRRADPPPAITDGGAVQQQIAELQDAARMNAENIRKLAADLEEAIAALEQGGKAIEARMRRIELAAYGAVAMSAVAVVLAIVFHG